MFKPKKQPVMLSKSLSSLNNTLPLRDFLGKKVYSTSGDFVGRVKNVLLHNEELAGFIVKGRKLLYVDKDYCNTNAVDSLILKIDPITMLKGKLVFGSRGKKLGRVIAIERTNLKNECSNIVVKKNIFTKPIKVAAADISVSKKNIILSKPYDQK